MAHAGELHPHAAAQQQERIGALRRFVRTSLGQHRRPHRLLQHPPSDDPRLHPASGTLFGQPLLRGRPARRMGGDDFGAPGVRRHAPAGRMLRGLRRAGCHPPRRHDDAGGGIPAGTFRHRQPQARTAALPRSPGQPCGHRAPPCDLPAERPGRPAVDRDPLEGPAAVSSDGRVQNLHPERRFRQQRNRLPRTGPERRHVGGDLLRSFAHPLRNGTDHHLPAFRQDADPAVPSPVRLSDIRHALLRRKPGARAFQARKRPAQDLGTPRAAGAPGAQSQQRRPAPLRRRNPHAAARRHRTDRPRPQATQPRHQLRGAGVPLPRENPLRLPTSTRSGTTSKTAPAPTIRTCPRAATSSN